jgi:hypothetical protein
MGGLRVLGLSLTAVTHVVVLGHTVDGDSSNELGGCADIASLECNLVQALQGHT